MMTRANAAPLLAHEQDQIFRSKFEAARRARAVRVKVRPHRAMTPLQVTPWLAAQAIVLPLLLCTFLVWVRPLLLEFWRNCILFWARGLDLPFSVSSVMDRTGQYRLDLPAGVEAMPMPGGTTMLVTAVVALLGLLLSLRLKNEKLPLKYPLRIVSVLQLVALVYFWRSPATFPYSIARHSEELMTIGYAVMVSTPVMLAVGYYLLNQRLSVKLFHTALILLFFAILIPHQVLAQAYIMEHLSVLFMPVLYICFGAVFDALIFVALYSWAVSNAPPHATT